MMKLQRHKYAQIVIILGLLLTACSNNNTVIDTQPVQEQEDTSEQGQTLNIVTPDVTNVESDVKEQYQIQTRLVDFHLINDTTGLAWGLTRNSLRLYLTEDRGETWINISPATNVQFTSNPRYGTDVFFIDENNGWIVRNGEAKNETVVLRTTNAGKQWKISSLPKADSIKGISFVSMSRGWIITSSATSMGKEEKYLFRTDDGGGTWKKIMQNTGSPNASKSSKDTPESISNQGYLTGMSFIDTLHGFVTLQELGSSSLYTTDDGGSSWLSVPDFVDSTKMSTCSTLELGNPQFKGKSGDHGFIPLACTVGDKAKFNGYFTSDQGATWQLKSFNLNWSQGLNQMLPPVFLNQNDGWYLQDSVVYHTLNQGKTWEALAVSRTLQDYIKMYPGVIKLEFISSKSGWILLENTDHKRSLLLQTLDGGITWKVL